MESLFGQDEYPGLAEKVVEPLRIKLKTTPKDAPKPCKYSFLDEESQLADMMLRLGTSPILAIDLEFSHTVPWLATQLLWQLSDGTHHYVGDSLKLPLSLLAPLLAGKTLIAHNAITEYQALRIAGVEHLDWICPLIGYQVAKAGLIGDDSDSGIKCEFKSAGLQTLADQYLGIYLKKELQSSFLDWKPGDIITQAQKQYAAEDVVYLHRIWTKLREELVGKELLGIAQLEFSLIPAFGDMALCGFRVDVKNWHSYLEELRKESRVEEEKVAEILQPYYNDYLRGEKKRITIDFEPAVQLGLDLGIDTAPTKTKLMDPTINLGSVAQIKDAIKTMKFDGYDSLRHEVLVNACEDLPLDSKLRPVMEGLLNLSGYKKLLTGFGMDFLKNYAGHKSHTIWPSIWQTGASATGRASCAKPNLQQVPVRGKLGSKFRELFIAQPNTKLIIADYSQLEQRIAAHLSQDPTMMRIFADGLDMHTVAAASIFDLPYEEMERAGRYDKKAGEYERKDAGWDPSIGKWTIKQSTLDEAGATVDSWWEDALTGDKLDGYVRSSGYLTIKHMRDEITKICSFATNYGGGPSTIQRVLRRPKEWCQHVYDKYVETYKGLFVYGEKRARLATGLGYTATSTGRKRFYRPTMWEDKEQFPDMARTRKKLSELLDKEPLDRAKVEAYRTASIPERQALLKIRQKEKKLWPQDIDDIERTALHRVERQGKNHGPQSLAADIIKLAMLLIWQRFRVEGILKVFGPDGRYLGPEQGACIILQVHDELVSQADATLAKHAKAIISECMLEAERRLIPTVAPGISCHIGTKWSQK